MTAQRILICLHDLHRGGTERIALGLAAGWSQAGRHVTILCGSLEGGLRDITFPFYAVPIPRALLQDR